MKNCPKCQASVSDLAKFCVKCGFNIKKFEEDNENKEYFCAECGTKFSGGTFCPECGYNIANDLMGSDFPGTIKTKSMDTVIDLDSINTMAQDQLYEKEGFVVENEVLVGYTGKKRSIIIRSSIEEIYDSAFENNEVIAFVEIENGVRIIGKRAFANCESLVKISIPQSVEKIYDDAFEGVKLDKLTLTEYNQDILNKVLSSQAKDYLGLSGNIDRYIADQNGRVTINILEIENDTKKAKAAAATKKAEEQRKTEEARKAEEKRKADEKRRRLLESWSVGKTVTFGIHNRQVPIEWIVLEREGTKALVISKYALEAKRYNDSYCGVTWESCSLRRWLNSYFFNTSFNAQEKTQICAITVNNPSNQRYGTNGGPSTTDHVFLLNSDEILKYSGFNITKCVPGDYAKAQKLSISYYGYSSWWLRSPGSRQNQAAYITETGSESYTSVSTELGIRPVMWVEFYK